MRRIRILVAEDSATVRKRLVEIVTSDPDFELVGEAADGKTAIEICQQQRPDIISMDMMMPLMSGLAATEYIMAHCPTPIMVVSASTNRGELFKIYEALAAGAVDVLEKPTDGEPNGAWERRYLSAAKLVSRIRVITHPRGRLTGLQTRVRDAKPIGPAPSRRYEIVAIGASTGGPGAIIEILRGLPEAFDIPVVVLLHINEPFGTAFADWLDGQTTRRVTHPKDGMLVADAAGRVLVAPGGQHLVVRDKRLFYTSGPERHSCRPSVDVLFETVATEYGASAAACLLTGMGRDGALGLLKIRQAGGITMAQDESTSIVYGMPREAALLGAAQQILRIGDIAPRLAALNRDKVEACA
jgi:two-component system, chemotaxis family, protein-glutamate methylesterase/glutaminase